MHMTLGIGFENPTDRQPRRTTGETDKMNMRQLVCTIAGILALAGLNGCSTEGDHHAGGLSDGRMVDDKHINERVRDELRGDPVYKFDDINVSTFAGVVQLSGFADSDVQKQRAQNIAQHVPGVLRVDNGITLKPAPPMPTGRTNMDNKIYSQ
jgi:hyperosmotically inducible periplasmic protein